MSSVSCGTFTFATYFMWRADSLSWILSDEWSPRWQRQLCDIRPRGLKDTLSRPRLGEGTTLDLYRDPILFPRTCDRDNISLEIPGDRWPPSLCSSAYLCRRWDFTFNVWTSAVLGVAPALYARGSDNYWRSRNGTIFHAINNIFFDSCIRWFYLNIIMYVLSWVYSVLYIGYYVISILSWHIQFTE